jgi:hypothetical protein
MSLGSNLLQAPRFILAGSDKYTVKLPSRNHKTEIIRAHTLDYDLYLENKDTVDDQEDYAVFLDEYLPYHPDFLIETIGPIHLNAEQYYRTINKFFSEIEKKFGVRTIIAAHPYSRYDLKPECFPGREIIKGRTVELVKRSKFVFAHMSTSINFAVLYKKPILFLTTDGISAIPQGHFIDHFARQFKKKPINADHSEELTLASELKMDEESYRKYYSNYIKASGSPQKPFWEIVADHIERVNQ